MENVEISFSLLKLFDTILQDDLFYSNCSHNFGYFNNSGKIFHILLNLSIKH